MIALVLAPLYHSPFLNSPSSTLARTPSHTLTFLGFSRCLRLYVAIGQRRIAKPLSARLLIHKATVSLVLPLLDHKNATYLLPAASGGA